MKVVPRHKGCATQIEPMESGDIRSGGENQRDDGPAFPSMVLLDDINHVVVTWIGVFHPIDRSLFDGDAMPLYNKDNSEKYLQSHHIT